MSMLPNPSEPIAGRDLCNLHWRRFFESLSRAQSTGDVDRAIARLQEEIDELKARPVGGGTIAAGEGIEIFGSLDSGYAQVRLAELADAGGEGAELVKIIRDAYGRVAGTESAEAPMDGKQYARQDGEWSEVAGGGGPGTPGPAGPPGPSSSCFPTASIVATGGDIAPGAYQDLPIPFGFTITGWRLIGGNAGAISIDVRLYQPGNVPTPADTICGPSRPTLASARYAESDDVDDWVTEIPSGSILRFHVFSASAISNATLVLIGEREI